MVDKYNSRIKLMRTNIKKQTAQNFWYDTRRNQNSEKQRAVLSVKDFKTCLNYLTEDEGESETVGRKLFWEKRSLGQNNKLEVAKAIGWFYWPYATGIQEGKLEF